MSRTVTALEKSTIAFNKAVDGVKSLAGTGSGKVHLLLPAANLNHHYDDELDN